MSEERRGFIIAPNGDCPLRPERMCFLWEDVLRLEGFSKIAAIDLSGSQLVPEGDVLVAPSSRRLTAGDVWQREGDIFGIEVYSYF